MFSTENVPEQSHPTVSPQSDLFDVEDRPKKGRKMKFADQTQGMKKILINHNQDFINSNGVTIQSKKFTIPSCSCLRRCNEIINSGELDVHFNNFCHSRNSAELKCCPKLI